VREHGQEGRLIVVEGADGAGTTTLARSLSDELNATYEFEQTEMPIGEEVTRLVSESGHEPETVALAFAADRAVHTEEVILPALEAGETVICDRYVHSSMVYQPAMGLEIDWVRSLNRSALVPDLTLVLDVSGDTAMQRVEGRGEETNVFENLEFQREVSERYARLPGTVEGEIVLIDGERPPQKVLEDALGQLERRGLA
jgi:dTMP kinase